LRATDVRAGRRGKRLPRLSSLVAFFSCCPCSGGFAPTDFDSTTFWGTVFLEGLCFERRQKGLSCRSAFRSRATKTTLNYSASGSSANCGGARRSSSTASGASGSTDRPDRRILRPPPLAAQCKHHEPAKTGPPTEIEDEVTKASVRLSLDKYFILTTARKTAQARTPSSGSTSTTTRRAGSRSSCGYRPTSKSRCRDGRRGPDRVLRGDSVAVPQPCAG
jgi:hypothetical protein